MTRGGTAPVAVICPKFEEVTLLFGVPKLGWLRALKASHRNCRLMPSTTDQFFKAPRSAVTTAGPASMFFPESPKVPGAFGAKAAVLKYWLSPLLLAALGAR